MPTKLTAYYAHPIALYGSPVERKDIKRLRTLGFKVINPANTQYRRLSMDQFVSLAHQADLVAFRAFDDGKIGSGVALEVLAAMKEGKPVIEMTPFLPGRVLTRNETRQRMCLPPLRHPETAPFGTILEDIREWDEHTHDQDWGAK